MNGPVQVNLKSNSLLYKKVQEQTNVYEGTVPNVHLVFTLYSILKSYLFLFAFNHVSDLVF